LSKDSVLNNIEFVLVAFNTVTNSYFTLDSSYFINTSGAVISNGIQQIVMSQSRGYTQLFDENFNRIEVSTGARVGDLQSYSFLFGQKIRWQDWLNNPNADTVFFDNTKPKDNLNFKSSNYSGLQDYQVKMVVIGRTSGTDDLGREGNGFDTFAGGNITVKDYGISDVAYTVSDVATFDPDTLVNLNGSILSDKPTLLESRFSTGAAPSLNNKLILHRYEKTKQLGNVLPEIEATLSIDGTDLVGQTLLDSSLFEQGVAYNFTSRLASPFKLFTFNTFFNNSVNPSFNPIFTGGVKTWIFGADSVIGDNPNYSGLFLDGNLRTVAVSSTDLFQITMANFGNKGVLTGDVDLTELNGLTFFDGRISDVESLTFPPNEFTFIRYIQAIINSEINFLEQAVSHNGGLALEGLNGNLTTGLGLLTQVLLTTVGIDKVLDLTSTLVNGSLSFVNAGNILLSNQANQITTLTATSFKSLTLDLSNTNITVSLNARESLYTTLILSSQVLRIPNIDIIQTDLTDFDIGGLTPDANAILWRFDNSNNLGVTGVDKLYNDIYNNWLLDGSPLLSLTIRTFGSASPSGASLTARTDLATAGANIIP
jgi:hypothetical protein